MPEVDRELFRRAVGGDREAFWRLVVPYRGLIYSVARGMLRDHDRAEDQISDVLLRAFRSLPNLREPARLPSWLYSITRNHIMDVARREQRLRKALAAAAPQMLQVVPMSEALEKEAWLGRMEEALADLPEPFSVILGMKYMNDYSCRQIAEILDISISATKSRLFAARKLLRKKTEALEANQDALGSHAIGDEERGDRRSAGPRNTSARESDQSSDGLSAAERKERPDEL